MATTPGPALLFVGRDPAAKKNIKNWKETRRKAINASQSPIRTFNDITGKHMNSPSVVFIFPWFSLKTNTFQAHFCRKQTLSFDILLVKTFFFPALLINVNNIFNVFPMCSLRKHFYVKKIVFNGKICRHISTNPHSTLHKKWSFPLRISSAKVIKPAVKFEGTGHNFEALEEEFGLIKTFKQEPCRCFQPWR